MSLYEIFGSDTLLLYLSDHLQSPTCTITKVGNAFWLGSSYIDALKDTGQLGTGTKGILSVLKLIDPKFDKKANSDKEIICVEGILSIINGVIKLKYNHYGLQHIEDISASTKKKGRVIDDTEEKKPITETKTLSCRINVQAPYSEFEEADKQPYRAVEIWDIAMDNAPVARVLHYFAKANEKDRISLRKVREEICEDTKAYWFKQLVGKEELEEFDQWVNNAHVGGDKAAHSTIKSHIDRAKGIEDTTSSPIDFQSSIMQWVNTK